MLAESTIRRMMRVLFAEAECTSGPRSSEAWIMATALQWALGGCDWTPMRVLDAELPQEPEALDAD